MKKIVFLIGFITLSVSAVAQIQGTITDTKGASLPFVNVYIEGTYTGTTSNENGVYKLDISQKKEYQLVFQYLGYETKKITINPDKFPLELNVVLNETSTQLDEVVINTSEDPAYPIIRNAIEKRKENLNKIKSFTSNFYSKGLWRVKDMPKKIMGQEVGDFDGALDSTRTGIIYLSETVSKIAFKRPHELKETIIASKVSGNDNGFSFNTAQDADFTFYNNTIDISASIVSPIASNALNYYNYKLEGVFYEDKQLINKIKVTPKRPNDRTWSGIIYIVEDSWQLYGVQLTTTGSAIQVPMVTQLVFKQNFSYNEILKRWVKISQTIDFGFDFFGFKGAGRFVAVYSNYNFNPNFEKNEFTNEVLSFLPEANKKDSLYWKQYRPIPLTLEEKKDYVKKDSIQTLRKSQKYLDSVDAKKNRFNILDPLMGYTYTNTFKKWNISYDAPLLKTQFNTVQGWNSKTGISYFKWYDQYYNKWLRISGNITYGLSDDRVRATGSIAKKFNSTNRLILSLSGGSRVQQFNASQPISLLINSISTLYFERNYIKLYELNYLQASYSQEISNGITFATKLSYQDRKPLFNTTSYVTLPQEDVSYTSNNPLAPTNFATAGFEKHSIYKSNSSVFIRFKQKYMSYPDGKYYIGNSDYPNLSFSVENGFGASNSKYNFTKVSSRVSQSIALGNKGRLRYNLHAGTFMNAKDISFIDYQHFIGNQTRVGTSSNYSNVFNLMPYYLFSTNKSYFEAHLEHNFKGWVLGKIPGINRLNYNLVLGAHLLSTKNNKPYTEFSLGLDNLGFGKFRFLRLDYVISNFNGKTQGHFVFGLKFLRMLNL